FHGPAVPLSDGEIPVTGASTFGNNADPACYAEGSLMRLVFSLLLAALAAFGQSAPPSSPIFDDVDDMLTSLSRITGWKIKHKVPSETLARDKFSKMVDQDATESEKDKSTRAAELTMKMFGLVPWDFNLARESANLIEEQAA